MAKTETGMLDPEPDDASPAEGALLTTTPTRDDIRTAILDSKGESRFVDFRGVQVELRAPELETLLQYRQGDNEIALIKALVENTWVPGTEERVFDDTDIPAIMKLKLTTDMKRMIKAIAEIMGDDESMNKAIEDNTKSNQE